MSTASARILRLLSLLEHHGRWSGAELAARLEISARTLRRDINDLRDLGYPVESTPGADGGYRLVPGSALPPLLLDDAEVIALTLGLHAAAHTAPAEVAEASVRALAKVSALLPDPLRRRADAVRAVTVAGQPRGAADTPSPAVLGQVALACRDGVRASFGYTAPGDRRTDRYVEPYRLVTLEQRWYLVAFDIDRSDWRTFRVDRIDGPELTRNRFEPRPLPAPDLAAYVADRIRDLRAVHEIEVILHAPLGDVTARTSAWWASAVPVGGEPARTGLTLRVESLDWAVFLVCSLGIEFDVVGPPALIARVAEHAARLTRAAEPPPRTR